MASGGRSAAIGFGGDRLDETRHQVGRHARQRHGDTRAGEQPLARGRSGFHRHAGIDVLDQHAECRIESIARLRQIHMDLGNHAAGIRSEDQNAVAHQYRFLDVVRHHEHRLDRHPAFAPQIEQIGTQRLRRQHVERRKGFIHQQNFRPDDERAGKANALAHTARQLLRIGTFKTVETDEVDGCERPLAPLGRSDALSLETKLDVLQHRQPGKERKALKNHGNVGIGAKNRTPLESDVALAWADEACNRAQQRGLAGAGAA